MTDYTRLTLRDIQTALNDIAGEAETIFGDLDASQLNWRPDATRWSVAQCFQHLLTANELMLRAANHALTGSPRTMWQRMPLVPGLLGRALIRSQAPEVTRKYKAPPTARPTASEIAPDIVARFAEQQRHVAKWVDALGETDATRAIMTSPFLRFITYSVLDACRLLVAHDHRHFQQAQRVLGEAQFPRISGPTRT